MQRRRNKHIKEDSLTRLTRALLSSTNSRRDKAILKLFLHTGCTPKEFVHIKNSDIDFAKNTIQTSKRTITLPAALIREIEQSSTPDSKYLFSARKSQKLTTRTIHRLFKTCSKALGEKITSHDVRKLWIQQSLRKNQDTDTGNKRFDTKPYLKKPELHKIRSKLSTRNKLLFDILFATGCQVNEVREIRVQDIDFARSILNIKQRYIRLPATLTAKLRAFSRCIPPQHKLFSTRQGEGITRERIFQVLQQAAREAGMKLTPKTLRYSYVFHNLHAGRSLEELQQESGIKHLDKFHLYGVFFHE